MRGLMYANPLTYGVEALRTLMYPEYLSVFSLTASIMTLLLFALFMFGLAFALTNRRTTKPAV
jgi:ABC-type polysaccharide/polyol phosphate export permease